MTHRSQDQQLFDELVAALVKSRPCEDRDDLLAMVIERYAGRISTGEIKVHGFERVQGSSGDVPYHASMALEGLEKSLRAVVDAGVSPDAGEFVGMSPVEIALNWDSPRALKLLIDVGADVRRANDQGNTPLHVAARSDRKHAPDCARVLLDAGASLEAVNHDGRTPIEVAGDNIKPWLLACRAEQEMAPHPGAAASRPSRPGGL